MHLRVSKHPCVNELLDILSLPMPALPKKHALALRNLKRAGEREKERERPPEAALQTVPCLLAIHYLFVTPHLFGVPHPTVMSYLLAILRACACACVCVCGAEKGQIMA